MTELQKVIGVTTQPQGTWVQTDRSAHEKWARLAIKNPRASSVLHVLVSNMGRHNAVLTSLPILAKVCDCSRSTLLRSLKILRDDQWIEVVQIGSSGTTNCYVINDRVAWSGNRAGIRYSMFSATVLAAEEEQPNQSLLGDQIPLTKIPSLYPNERQLPSGNGLPPPSQPSFDGLEPDLPARTLKEQENT